MADMDRVLERPLAELLHAQAIRQGVREIEQGLPDEAETFELVRDMTYSRPSANDLKVLISEWRGTCSGKHILLQALYAELGYRSTLMACTQQVRISSKLALPKELLEYIAEKPLIDVHNYLVLHSQHGDMIMDATWPLSARVKGLPVNDEFVWGKNMQLACVPLETFPVPSDMDPHSFKAALLRERCDSKQLEYRETFIVALGKLF